MPRHVNVRRVEAEEAGHFRRAKRLGRRQKVDRFEEVRLPLAVAAYENVDRAMKALLSGSEIAVGIGGQTLKDHVSAQWVVRSEGSARPTAHRRLRAAPQASRIGMTT